MKFESYRTPSTDTALTKAQRDLLLYKFALKEALSHPQRLGLSYLDHILFTNSFLPDSFVLQRSIQYIAKICRTCAYIAERPPGLHVKLRKSDKDGIFGLFVAYTKPTEYSLCSFDHILRACSSITKTIESEKNSFFSYSKQSNQNIFYLEIRTDPRSFFLLRKHLLFTLPYFIEETQSTCDVALNEEDILRNILLLKENASKNGAPPQMAIHFYRQKNTSIECLVTLVRKAPKEDETFTIPQKSILLQQTVVSSLRSRKKLEAIVLIVRCDKSACIRTNGSIDYLKAREAVAQIMAAHFGPVRDLNGGLLLQQKEFLHVLEGNLKNDVETLIPLVQELYATLAPPVMRNTLIVDQMLLGAKLLQQLKTEPNPYLQLEKNPCLYIACKNLTAIPVEEFIKIGRQSGLKSHEIGISHTIIDPFPVVLLFVCSTNSMAKKKLLQLLLNLLQ